MKKSFLSISVLVLSLAMSLMFICSQVARAESSGNTFIYDKNDKQEIIYTLDQTGKHLTPKLKYEYEKDDNGNTISKTAYRWNKLNNKWNPYYMMTFGKEGDQNYMQYGLWNETSGDYTLNIQKTVYAAENNQKLISYINYQWNQDRGSWSVREFITTKQYLASTLSLK